MEPSDKRTHVSDSLCVFTDTPTLLERASISACPQEATTQSMYGRSSADPPSGRASGGDVRLVRHGYRGCVYLRFLPSLQTSEMQRGDRFPLAEALFGWPAAPGQSAPGQQVPDTWLVLFRDQHAAPDPEVLSGMFCSCKSGRDWVLEAAPQITVTLNTTRKHEDADSWPPSGTRNTWPHRFSVITAVFSTRGTRPIHLKVLCDDSVSSAQACARVPALLCDAGSAVTHLTLTDQPSSGACPSSAFTGLLHHAAPAARGLQSLSLHGVPCLLPPPCHIPELTHLSAEFQYEEDWDSELLDQFCSSAADHLAASLTSFRLEAGEREIPWELLFEAGAVRITHLHTDDLLRGWLVRLLVEHAPRLEQLHVQGVSLQKGDSSAGSVWPVRTLRFNQAVTCDALARLPMPKSGHMQLEQATLDLDINSPQGLSQAIRARLPHWHLIGGEVRLRSGRTLRMSEHPDVLRHTLTQLSTALHGAQGTQLHINIGNWDDTTTCQYVAAIPALVERGFDFAALHSETALTDRLLSAVLAASEHIRTLSVPRVRLQSDTHANAPWPWEELSVDRFDLSMLARLPWPGGEGAPRKVVCEVFCIDSVTPEVESRLGHLQFSVQAHEGVNPILLRCPAALQELEQAEALQGQIRVLGSLDKAFEAHDLPTVCLHGWTMTRDVMSALEALPGWSGPVEGRDCTWPLSPSEYSG